MKIIKNNVLQVYYNNRLVGTLAKSTNNLIAFEYSADWLESGFSISPLSLPLEKKVFFPKTENYFEGLFGVFNDSLPDGWGKLLIDRYLLKNNIDSFSVTSIDRLSIVSSTGMGALEYKPDQKLAEPPSKINMDEISAKCINILNSEYQDNLDLIVKLAGSSGGARPKILTKIDGEDWIIKFPTSFEDRDLGKKEYEYSICAKACGIDMPETRLFKSDVCLGYFGVKRFDRKNNRKIHVVSVSGLLETTHRIPNLDYNILMALTLKLTNDYNEIEKLYRQMCFNVFAHNRDDHSKNFAFIYNEEIKQWQLSPAYDLTYSASINGEHATTINNEGKNPTNKDILSVAQKIGMKMTKAEDILFEIKEKTSNLITH